MEGRRRRRSQQTFTNSPGCLEGIAVDGRVWSSHSIQGMRSLQSTLTCLVEMCGMVSHFPEDNRMRVSTLVALMGTFAEPLHTASANGSHPQLQQLDSV